MAFLRFNQRERAVCAFPKGHSVAMDEAELDLNQTVVANENDDGAKGDLQDEDASAEMAIASENPPFQAAAGNGSSPKLASPVRDEYVLSNKEPVPSPSSKGSPSPPARGTPSPRLKQSTKPSRSPSPKKRRSSPAARRSSSKDPEERRYRSRSPDARHGRRRDDGRRRHDRSYSPSQRMNHRERSRSWSPHDRERDRYRSRYSPRRRSSPPRYSSRGMRSPRKRPWSPPRNRNTGLGKPGNHLFVAGFSFATNERDLEKKFGRYGRVSDVRIIRDRRSGDSRGFGFLSLERDEEADAAIEGLDQTEWNGRIVLVEKAKTT